MAWHISNCCPYSLWSSPLMFWVKYGWTETISVHCSCTQRCKMTLTLCVCVFVCLCSFDWWVSRQTELNGPSVCLCVTYTDSPWGTGEAERCTSCRGCRVSRQGGAAGKQRGAGTPLHPNSNTHADHHAPPCCATRRVGGCRDPVHF